MDEGISRTVPPTTYLVFNYEEVCEPFFYFNELACKCFSMAYCFAPCPDGQYDMPTIECGCTEVEQEYLNLFPRDATDEDIARSIRNGITTNAFFDSDI